MAYRRAGRLGPARAARGLTLAAALSLTVACGSSSTNPPVCPDDVPAGCPSPAPTFAADAQPIFQARCVKCHAPGQMAATIPFQTYDEIAPLAGDINLQLQLCAMPLPPEPPLGAADRQKLFGWILCGALND
jgi:hypothetical protein